jgi:selenocysteine lyase/cysteine desulfurase
MLSDDQTWQDLRDAMPAAEKWAYFDHAAVAPLTRPAQEALTRWVVDTAENGVVNSSYWRKEVERARKLGAAMLGADTDEIALVHNTTEGVNLVAEGLPWRPGDNLIALSSEFPTNRFAWMNLQSRGVEARILPVGDERVDLQQIADACDNRTRLIAVSWVGYATGWRNDVDALVELAHRKGALFFLDAIQALGVFPLNVRKTPVDFLAADGHKWLLSPEGAGYFYVRKEHLDLLRPIGVGWNSVQNSGNYAAESMNLKASAGRYEGGSYNMGGIAALAASVELFLNIGIERIAGRLLEVTDLLTEQLRGIGADVASCREGDRRSGILSFTQPGKDPFETKKQCLARGVAVNCRNGRVRVSPHAYTDNSDLERLIECLTGNG